MIVLRVANFEGEDAKCTVGQVIDNYAEGRVKVWWVDGHISMCWPQDLFEVGQPEESFWINGDSENDEDWETESDTSGEPGSQTDTQLKPQLSYNLERARVAMAHLEEIFKLNPNLENQGVRAYFFLSFQWIVWFIWDVSGGAKIAGSLQEMPFHGSLNEYVIFS